MEIQALSEKFCPGSDKWLTFAHGPVIVSEMSQIIKEPCGQYSMKFECGCFLFSVFDLTLPDFFQLSFF